MSSTQHPPHADLKFIQCNTNSFLPTDRHSGFLINTHTHTSFKHGGIQALFLMFLPAQVLFVDTQRLHLSTSLSTLTLYCVCGIDTRCESDSHRLQIFPVPQLKELVPQHSRVKTWGGSHTQRDEVGFHSDLWPLLNCQGLKLIGLFGTCF